jgi:hypothetical protein
MTDLKHPQENLDDLLADFTDRVLDGKNTGYTSSVDDEMRGLEETILHLQQTLPHEPLDNASLRRLQADFKSRTRSAKRASRSSWQSRQSRQRWTLAFVSIAILAAIFIAIPLSITDGGNLQATAGFQPQSILLVLFAAGGIIALFIWLRRHK